MNKRIFLSGILCAALVLSGCLGTPVQTAQPTIGANEIAAVVVQTIQAQNALLTANAPANTSSPTISLTPTATFTPTTSATETFTLTPVMPTAAVSTIPCNQAIFIGDITIPDGTQISAGKEFTKTWRLENAGSCTWTPAYLVIFDHGDLLSGASSFNMPGYVNPGQTVDISVSLIAPVETGTYEGFWGLEDANGNRFGLGAGAALFEELIVVGNAQPNLAVRHVYMSMDNTSVTAACPPGHQFRITADIWTNGNGDVLYRWEFSDGRKSDDRTIHLDSARHAIVSTSFDAGRSGSYWARIHILQPDDKFFDQIDFTLICTPAVPTNTRPPTTTKEPTSTHIPINTKAPTSTHIPTNTEVKK